MGFKTINGKKVFIDDNRRSKSNGRNDESNGMKIGNGTRVPKNFEGIDLKSQLTKQGDLSDQLVSRKNFSLEFDTIGNIESVSIDDDTAGFRWSGNEDDIGEFLSRIANSIVSGQFIDALDEMEINELAFEKLKDQWKQNLAGELEVDENDDGLYSLSGDNAQWKFGGDSEIEVEEIFREFFEFDEADLTEQEQDLVKEEAFNQDRGFSYGDFLEESGESLRKEVLKVIDDSDSFQELFDRLNDESFEQGILEDVFTGRDGSFRSGIHEATNLLRKEGKIKEKVEE